MNYQCIELYLKSIWGQKIAQGKHICILEAPRPAISTVNWRNSNFWVWNMLLTIPPCSHLPDGASAWSACVHGECCSVLWRGAFSLMSEIMKRRWWFSFLTPNNDAPPWGTEILSRGFIVMQRGGGLKSNSSVLWRVSSSRADAEPSYWKITAALVGLPRP